MATQFPANQVAVVDGPQTSYDFRQVWTSTPIEGGYSYSQKLQRKAVRRITVQWRFTKLADDVVDTSADRWTAPPTGYTRAESRVRVTNALTMPMLCQYIEVWEKRDETWEDV